jgi:hypothetical protein
MRKGPWRALIGDLSEFKLCAGRLECRWQRDQLPEAIRELVFDDQRLRNDICWSVFDC